MDVRPRFVHDTHIAEGILLLPQFTSLLLMTIVFLWTGCSPPQPPPGASFKMTPGARFKWKTLCSTCHGLFGKGDGAAGMKLKPRPRDFADPEWQASVTDEYLAKIIVEGGLAVGKSKDMPSNPDLETRAADLRSLVAKIRSFVPRKHRKTQAKPQGAKTPAPVKK